MSASSSEERRNPAPKLEIVQDGRGGGMTYHEGENHYSLSWEFALEPAIALIFGTRGDYWDRANPWAAGRQKEIYDFIGAEVVRQQVSGGDFEVDLDTGMITILRARRGYAEIPERNRAIGPRPTNRGKAPVASKAWTRFVASIAEASTLGDPEVGYDVAALADFNDLERADATALLEKRGEAGWREVEAFAAIGTAQAVDQLQLALTNRLSVAARLIAARALHARGLLPDVETVLCRALRFVHNPRDGLREALAMAEESGSDAVKQALLYASYNQTPCAPPCAALLLRLTGSTPIDDEATTQLLRELDLHNSSFTRQAAFATLCNRAGMTLEGSSDY